MSSREVNHFLLNSESTRNQLICVVCGSVARGYNFNAITCMSCKIFFRRNALTKLDKLRCYQGGNCHINPRTRRYCTYCRLRTCFRMGMRKQLIREYKECSRNSIDRNQEMCIRPLDLLQWSDRSCLSNIEWTLLRQLSSVFDTLSYHSALKAHEELSSIGIQPLKMRVKASYIYEMVSIFVKNSIEFVKSIPQFKSLLFLNKQILLMRNTRPVIMFYSSYQTNLNAIQKLIQTPYWITSTECLLLPSTKYLCDKITSEIRNITSIDLVLIKLILAILAFSTNNIDYDQRIFNLQLNEYYHTFILQKIQNMYVELMWKYLIYRFGETHAIHLHSTIIKVILRVQSFISLMDNSKIISERKFHVNIAKITDQIMRMTLSI